MPVRVDTPEIAGAEPTVLSKSFGGRLRVAIITGKDHRPLDQNFADPFLVRVEYLDLGPVHRLADRTDLIIVLIGCGRGAACFGQYVALQDRKAKLVKVHRNVFIETRAGRDGDA